MEITYLNHACFKIKGKNGTVLTDPYQEKIGFALPSLSIDVITTSHDHFDHNAVEKVHGTARRPKPFVISNPGEYEVGGISVFGMPSFHDANQGADRGKNTIFTLLMDDMRICHLGDLGHELSDAQLEEIGIADILLCPVGGVYSLDPKMAVKVIQQIEPGIVIPMHYKTDAHGADFASMSTLADFLKEYGMSPEAQPKLTLDKSKVPEETQLVVLTPQV